MFIGLRIFDGSMSFWESCLLLRLVRASAVCIAYQSQQGLCFFSLVFRLCHLYHGVLVVVFVGSAVVFFLAFAACVLVYWLLVISFQAFVARVLVYWLLVISCP